MGKILEKAVGRPVKTVYTAITKGISFLGGDAVSYDKQGLGLKQAWNEPHYDSIFQDMLTDKEKSDLNSGFTSENDMESILQRFSSEKGYNKMNYPASNKMIETAKENFDNSPMGSIYKPKKEKNETN
jgi:hypothetical protein